MRIGVKAGVAAEVLAGVTGEPNDCGDDCEGVSTTGDCGGGGGITADGVGDGLSFGEGEEDDDGG